MPRGPALAADRADVPSASAGYRPSARFVVLLGAMAALGAVTTDTYLPSLPQVATDLGTSTAAAQFTISAVLIGAALGQLFIGPLSDRFGRRRPALFGIVLHVVASLGCMVVPSIGGLVALRMLQGIGNSATTVTAMAVIRDRLTGGPAARVLSRLILVIGIAPLLAPSLGGYVAGVAGWRAVFAVLAAFGVVLFVVVWRFLPETLPTARRTSPGLSSVLAGYRSLVTDRAFLALAVLPGLAMGAILSYVAGAPFVLQEGYGLSEQQFALVFALNGLGGIIASQVNAALMKRSEPMSVLRVALPVTVLLAVGLVAVAVTGAGGLVGLLIPLWLVMSAVIFVPPNASALALSRRGDRAGTAAALIGALQAGTAGVVSPVVGLLGGDARAMSVVILAVLLVALSVLALGTTAYRGERDVLEPAPPSPAGGTPSESREPMGCDVR